MPSKETQQLIDRFRAARILTIGDIMLDEYIIGAVTRICPEAPVPILDVKSRYSSAGGAANVAMNIASLGASVHLVGLASEDSAGQALKQLLTESFIAVSGIVDAGDRGTISKTRIVAGQQQICRIDHETRSPVPVALTDDLIRKTESLIPACSIVVLSDYAKGVLSDRFCEIVIAFARAHGKPVIVDPKSRSFQKYGGCTLITPNLSEASIASGIEIHSEESLHRAGAVLSAQLPETHILITRGADGMALFESTAGARPFLIPTLARQVFDVVGAGDTVVATLAIALAAGIPLRQAVSWSNVAAGIAVEKRGTATVTAEELIARQNPGLDGEHGPLHQGAEHMRGGDVNLLDPSRLC